MLEKINKIIVQNAAAMVIIVVCLSIAVYAAGKGTEIPQANLGLINKIVDVCLMGVIGYLFTAFSKKQ